MKKFAILFALALVLCIPLTVAHAAPLAADPAQPLDFDALAKSFGSLAGVAALVPAIVNALKVAKVIPDGRSPEWMMVLNMVGFIGLGVLQLTGRADLVPVLDEQAGLLATTLTVVVGYIAQLFVSRITHQHVLAGLPVIGKSYSGRSAGDSISTLEVG